MPQPEPMFLNRRDRTVLAELDPQITPRMREQAAHHTVCTNVFQDHAPMLVQLAEAASTPGGEPLLRRIPIASSCKSKALPFLAEEMKLTASTIFPDVVGLGRFLRWQFESLRTMML